jgi:hypothetical protein
MQQCLETNLVGKFRTSSNEIRGMETLWGRTGGPKKNVLEMIVNGSAWVIERYEPDRGYVQAREETRRHKRAVAS